MRKIIVLIFVIYCYGISYSQISLRNIPHPSKNYHSLRFPLSDKSEIHIITMPAVNVDSLYEDEEIKAKQSTELPFCFGYGFNVNYNMKNSGTWDTLENGGRLWRLRIVCPGAYSINFSFINYFLPDSALFFIYNEDENMVLGAFSKLNNKKHKMFDTDLIKGDTAILEYYEPLSVCGKGFFEMSWIVYGYKNLFELEQKTLIGIFNKYKRDKLQVLPWCSKDVNCSEGNDWCLEKRSVTGTLIKETPEGYYRYWASGCLLKNNSPDDFTPYILTARHALSPFFPDVRTLFRFSYYNSECDGNSQPEVFSYDGGSLVADYENTDMALLLMEDTPQPGDNVYYAGWSYTNPANEPAPKVTCLHHPDGAPMQITLDDEYAVSSTYPTKEYLGEVYWKIQANSDVSYVEGGSSGAPYFNEDRKVVAQHRGHTSSSPCSGNSFQYGGKFSESWLGGGTNETQLKHWLAPNSQGDIEIDGMWRGSELTLYGLIHDPNDERSDDYYNYTYDQHKVFFNIGPIKTGGGVVDEDIYPFKVKYYPTPPYEEDGPGKVTLVSRKRIVLRSCTQILHGSKFHAYIDCSNDELAENTGNVYSDLCQPPGPKIPFIQKSLFNNKDELKSQISAIIPNPFSNATTINYVIAEQSSAKILVSNIYNQVLRVLLNDPCHSNGEYAITLDSKDLASGVYYVTLITPNHSETKLMMIIK